MRAEHCVSHATGTVKFRRPHVMRVSISELPALLARKLALEELENFTFWLIESGRPPRCNDRIKSAKSSPRYVNRGTHVEVRFLKFTPPDNIVELRDFLTKNVTLKGEIIPGRRWVIACDGRRAHGKSLI